MLISQTRPALYARKGLTLIEILIALTMTLIVLGAMMTAFSYASQQMQMGRAVMEMANRLRAAEELLRSDLANVTVDPRPYTESTNPNGYWEYVEGPRRDKDSAGTNDSYLGDVDDVLAMTVRSSEQLFRGRSGSTIVESLLAEIVWFTTLNDLNNDGLVDFSDSVRVHRRVLLIRPDFGTILSGIVAADVNLFLATNDISCRVVFTDDSNTTFDVVANSLGDLSVRKNRFCHVIDPYDDLFDLIVGSNNFPNALSRVLLNIRKHPQGDDIMLTDVAGFDVRLYSPDATVSISSDIVVEPGDVGFVASTAALGAFVDLDHDGVGWFENPLNTDPLNTNPLRSYTFNSLLGPESAYDTWTPFYESDGINQDDDYDVGLPPAPLIDEGTNGVDNGGSSAAPDDDSERETRPPYPFPVRGVKVSIRLIEKTTKQIHQSSVIHSYVPE